MSSLELSALTSRSTSSNQHIRPKLCLSLDMTRLFISVFHPQGGERGALEHRSGWDGEASPGLGGRMKPCFQGFSCMAVPPFFCGDRWDMATKCNKKHGESMSRYVKARRPLCWMRLTPGQGQGGQKLQHPISRLQRTGVREARSPRANSHREEVQWHLDVAWLDHVAAVCTRSTIVPMFRSLDSSRFQTITLNIISNISNTAEAMAIYPCITWLTCVKIMQSYQHMRENARRCWRYNDFFLNRFWVSFSRRIPSNTSILFNFIQIFLFEDILSMAKCLVSFTRLPAMARHSCTPSGK